MKHLLLQVWSGSTVPGPTQLDKVLRWGYKGKQDNVIYQICYAVVVTNGCSKGCKLQPAYEPARLLKPSVHD